MFSERLEKLEPYVAGEQPRDQKYIKLNTNENPFPPPPAFGEVLRNYDYSQLRLYPDASFTDLRKKMGEVYALDARNIFICNGSDEGLSFCFFAFFDKNRGKVLFPNYTYSFYPVYCNFYDLDYEKIPLTTDFILEVEPYLQRNPSTGIIFPNPNAPTGIFTPVARVEYLLQNYPSNRVIIVDEAYIDFGGESVLPLLARYKNLVIVRTFSKAFSCAGLRLGYIFAAEELIAALFKVKDSFNSYPLNRLTQELACTAMDNYSCFQEQNRAVIRIREYFSSQLRTRGWQVLPSGANFVFARIPGKSGKALQAALKTRGILVRNFNIKGIEDFLRISIGRQDDMDTLLKELDKMNASANT